jgi:hypothetical protein
MLVVLFLCYVERRGEAITRLAHLLGLSFVTVSLNFNCICLCIRSILL